MSITSKLLELSNIIYDVKEKLTDAEYKNIMDLLGETNSAPPAPAPAPEVKYNINIGDFKINGGNIDDIDNINENTVYDSLTIEQIEYLERLGFYHLHCDDLIDLISGWGWIDPDDLNDNYIHYSQAEEWVFETFTDENLNEENFIDNFLETIENHSEKERLFKYLMKQTNKYIVDEEDEEEDEEERRINREIIEEEKKRIKNNRECPRCRRKDYDRIIPYQYICNLCYEKYDEEEPEEKESYYNLDALRTITRIHNNNFSDGDDDDEEKQK